MTADYWKVCLAGGLLFLSIYILLPILPVLGSVRMGEEVNSFIHLFPAFAAGLLAVGPFHAYLEDAYSRKGILRRSIIAVGLCSAGYFFANQIWQVMLLALVEGMAAGLAVSAIITISIDISVSKNRTKGNLLFSVFSRTGMITGLCLGVFLEYHHSFRLIAYVILAALLLAYFLVSRIYVAFRAPIGLRLFNLDRFVLLRAWVPTINVMLFMAGATLQFPSLIVDFADATGLQKFNVYGQAVTMILLTIPFLLVFLRLTSHCERCTANNTLYFGVEMGALIGLWTGYRLIGEEVGTLAKYSGIILLTAILCYWAITYPYYRKRQCKH